MLPGCRPSRWSPQHARSASQARAASFPLSPRSRRHRRHRSHRRPGVPMLRPVHRLGLRDRAYGLGDRPANLCPWCIADGSAARKFGSEFVGDIEGEVPASVEEELNLRTPGYLSWHCERWQICCGDACAYLGPVGWDRLRTCRTPRPRSWTTAGPRRAARHHRERRRDRRISVPLPALRRASRTPTRSGRLARRLADHAGVGTSTPSSTAISAATARASRR